MSEIDPQPDDYRRHAMNHLDDAFGNVEEARTSIDELVPTQKRLLALTDEIMDKLQELKDALAT